MSVKKQPDQARDGSGAIRQHSAGELADGELTGYSDWLRDVKARVRATQFKAMRAANREVLDLYWSIGRDIVDRQKRDGWGVSVVERLSRDLMKEFPDQQGWSVTSLRYMRRVARQWPTIGEFRQHAAGELPWGHLMLLMDRVKNRDDLEWYAARAVSEGWKRGVLGHFIKAGLKAQIGTAPTNFEERLDSSDSELAQQLVKDPYVFEHLAYVKRVTERDVENALMDRLQETLTEFGRGMSFVGRQVRFAVTDEKGRTDELVLDLLLFNIPQSRYVVVELKIEDFQPAFLGQLAAYVGLVDTQLRDPEKHAPTIGILLCTGRNEAVVRFTLANMTAALGVADYEGLPAEAKAALPTAAELKAVMDAEQAEHLR